MERRRSWWTHWPLVVLIVVIVACGAAVLLVSAETTAGKVARLLWGVIPASIALWQYSYVHIEAHRLWVNRMRMWLANPELSWALEVEFDVPNAAAALSAAQACVVAQMTAVDTILSKDSRSFVAQVHGVTMRLASDRADEPENATAMLRLDVPASRRSWRGWKAFVDRDIPRLLEAVDQAVGPKARKFVIDISFIRDNPYFGLFVHQVPEASLVRFDIEYFEHPDRTGAVIRVHRDKIQIVTDSIQSSRVLSLQFLALEPVGAHQ